MKQLERNGWSRLFLRLHQISLKKKRRALYIDIGKETFNFNPKMYVSLCCMAKSIIRKILKQIWRSICWPISLHNGLFFFSLETQIDKKCNKRLFPYNNSDYTKFKCRYIHFKTVMIESRDFSPCREVYTCISDLDSPPPPPLPPNIPIHTLTLKISHEIHI